MSKLSNCVFCQKVEDGSAEYVGDGVYRLEPLNPVTNGHQLFISGEHTEDATASTALTGLVFGRAAMWGNATSFNLITSIGESATQTIKHFHVHYVPRRKDDGLHLPWTNQTMENE